MKGKLEVIPRYTCGSPAMVDTQTGLRVAEEEKQFIQYYLEGSHGEAGKAKAERLGLHCIVLEDFSTAVKPRFRDVITGDEYVDVPYGALRNDPDTIIAWRKGSKVLYYFRRQLIHTAKATEDGTGMAMIAVLKAIKNIVGEGFEPYSLEASALWQNRKHA